MIVVVAVDAACLIAAHVVLDADLEEVVVEVVEVDSEEVEDHHSSALGDVDHLMIEKVINVMTEVVATKIVTNEKVEIGTKTKTVSMANGLMISMRNRNRLMLLKKRRIGTIIHRKWMQSMRL